MMKLKVIHFLIPILDKKKGLHIPISEQCLLATETKFQIGNLQNTWALKNLATKCI